MFYFSKNRPRLTFENLALKTMFHFIDSFLTGNIVSCPRQISVAGTLQEPPQNLRLKVLPWQIRETDTVNMSHMG